MGWFTHLSKFVSGTFIKADQMNDKLDRIATSFAYLPAPKESGDKGFLTALAIGGATKQDHAVSAGQAVNQSFNTGLDLGTANNYVVTIPITVTVYTDGMEISFKPINNNTGASQINLNGLGNVALKKADGSDLSPGDLAVGSYATFRYNGTEFRSTALLAGDADDVTEAKQWAVGLPSEPAGYSAKYWADSVNGLAYMRSDVAAQGGIGSDVATDTLDWNNVNVTKAGCSHYMPRGTTPNGPGDPPYYYPFTFEYTSKDGTGNLTQFAVGYNTNKLHMRYRLTGTWTSWVEFITTDNFNATGDARYLQKAGDTFTGDVGLGWNALKAGGNNAVKYVAGFVEFGVNALGVNSKLAGEAVNIEIEDWWNVEILLSGTVPTVQPDVNNTWVLGNATRAWKEITSYSYVTASDERLKNIKNIGDTSWLYDLEPIAYEWKDKPCGLRYGFSAQKTYEVMPNKSANLVKKPEKDGLWGMAPDQLIAPMLAEIKKLRQRIEQLEAK